MFKICNHCKESKSLPEFYKRKDGYYRHLCKHCWAIYTRPQRLDYQKNRADKVKITARASLQAAVRHGKIEKLPCEKCGEIEVEAHHHMGYSKEYWRIVKWLCTKHHKEAHAV